MRDKRRNRCACAPPAARSGLARLSARATRAIRAMRAPRSAHAMRDARYAICDMRYAIRGGAAPDT
ncbi:hypothetical protein AQ949_19470 [Burkholderia pseudomallei]|uniref:Uncharacterized protein n=1 Tax=Burkholderia pseudomallei (strain 1106a) TaxID=357348 RepID=A3P9C9_BURP0|nr:hypothetical protein BURPS1106A_A2910 [Burkholderia pseudomallei 1106a]EES21493.1 hypothetical protein BURPS1106B_2264 [Burkholderia pseudomallei 1106b]OMT27494.1 hypothetical protein AQ756_14805 [Burkholderia pseudomallei]OMT71499.1 hypothetical protein AQ763_26395 [Burkholderia pseudomallei]OMT88619.1 hypothetical protein AQ767_03665 [Burkholderia pseudomallei]